MLRSAVRSRSRTQVNSDAVAPLETVSASSASVVIPSVVVPIVMRTSVVGPVAPSAASAFVVAPVVPSAVRSSVLAAVVPTAASDSLRLTHWGDK